MMSAGSNLITIYAKQLRLPSFARYPSIVREAEQNHWGYEEFLLNLMKHEVENRQENRRKTRIKKAKFPLIKTLDTLNLKNLPNVDPAMIWQLADCSFIERKEGVVCIGPPGTGKTHTAIGLGLQACQKGYNVRFYTAAGLVNELLEAQNQHRLSKLEKYLSKIHLLILDELSYLTFSRPSAELLFQVLSARNETSSVIITTNLEFSRWTEIFGDNMLTAAVVDRVVHRSHIIDTNGPSYRLKQRLYSTNPVTDNESNPKEEGKNQDL
jgi:DNA replication protein DnaC